MKANITKTLLGILLLLSGSTSFAQSNTKPFVLGITDELWSSQLSEKRTLNIYLPDGYNKDSAKTYPVIYLLDGSADEDFVHITGVVQFLTMIGVMQPTIIVGIANIDRKRDFTFPTTIKKDKEDYPTTGSSAKFILFVERDLEPYVQKNYRVSASRTIIGQSLGGLVATEILLEKPQLFDNYIIVSPSLWWDNESLLMKAPALLKSLPSSKMNVYISVGSEGAQMEGDALRLAADIIQQAKPDLNVLYCPLPEENHLTILHNSVYLALEKLNAKK